MTLTGTGRDLLDDELLADFDERAPVYDRHNAFDPTSPRLMPLILNQIKEETMVTERLARCLESGDFAPFARPFAPDALFDAHVPAWRFQLEGPEATTGQLRSWWPVQGRPAAWEVTTSEHGFVVQFERWWRESDDDVNAGSCTGCASRPARWWRTSCTAPANGDQRCGRRWPPPLRWYARDLLSARHCRRARSNGG